MIEDAELTRRVRDGDDRAAEELYRRHHRAVLSYAARLSHDPQTAEDLASEAFARTLRTVRSGSGGPSGTWRPYLYAVVRNTASAWARSARRQVLTSEFADVPAESEADPEDGTRELAARAYESLPERWKTVLWHTVIEEESPDQVAGVLGTTRNNVNVLAFRAREGLRRAYLKAHLTTVTSPECHAYADRIAVAVRKPGNRLPHALRQHLDSCPRCSRAHTDLLDLNTTLRAAIPFALLVPLAKQGAALGVHSATGATVTAASAKTAGATAKGLGVKGIGAKGIGGVAAGSLAVAVAVGLAVWHGSGPKVAVPPPAASPSAASPPAVSSSATPPPATARPTPTRSTPRKTPTPRPIAGTRVRAATLGTCVGAKGDLAVALPCGDRRTAWRRDGDGNFRLVNKASGRCLTAGEHYDRASFNGGGIWAVRVAPCATAGTWSAPVFSDQVTRLVNDATGGSLSIGKTFSSPPPTAFILYGAYTGSSDQRFTLS
ncbi:hypothetical protein GCM10029978_020520 [Actinoallomurus acanthiterrae]